MSGANRQRHSLVVTGLLYVVMAMPLLCHEAVASKSYVGKGGGLQAMWKVLTAVLTLQVGGCGRGGGVARREEAAPIT